MEVNDTSIGLGPQHEDEGKNHRNISHLKFPDMLTIRDLTIEKMKEAFSKRSLSQREKIDTTTLYKKLEVELINAQNSKMELEKELKENKQQVEKLSKSNSGMFFC